MATRLRSTGHAMPLSGLVLAGMLVLAPTEPGRAEPSAAQASATATTVAEVLKGDTWLRHHREDLMPYWDLPAALGVPVGNFPSFRGQDGELLR